MSELPVLIPSSVQHSKSQMLRIRDCGRQEALNYYHFSINLTIVQICHTKEKMLIKMWITYLLINIPPFVEGKNTAETAYLWTKNAKKTGLSTTFPQNVDIWIVTMWKCG